MPSRTPYRRAALRLAVALAPVLSGCARADAARTELVVSAAASLRDVMAEVTAAYQAQRPETVVRLNAAASGTLAQQIRHGADVDLFVSAAAGAVDALAEEGLLVSGSPRVLAGNELVLVVPDRGEVRIERLEELASPGVERVAVGAPASVPAGAYALAALSNLGLWGAVEPKTVLAASVRQALAYVERGEVDAALVYRTDALRGRGVRVVAAVPSASHPPITYVAALVAGSDQPRAARDLLHFVAGPQAGEIFRRHGFAPAPEQ